MILIADNTPGTGWQGHSSVTLASTLASTLAFTLASDPGLWIRSITVFTIFSQNFCGMNIKDMRYTVFQETVFQKIKYIFCMHLLYSTNYIIWHIHDITNTCRLYLKMKFQTLTWVPPVWGGQMLLVRGRVLFEKLLWKMSRPTQFGGIRNYIPFLFMLCTGTFKDQWWPILN